MSSAPASEWSRTAMAQRKACSDSEAASWIPFKAIFSENAMVPAAGPRGFFQPAEQKDGEIKKWISRNFSVYLIRVDRGPV